MISLGWINIFGINKDCRVNYIKHNYQSLLINKILKKKIPGNFIPVANYCLIKI